jgi:hypothetical protein
LFLVCREALLVTLSDGIEATLRTGLIAVVQTAKITIFRLRLAASRSMSRRSDVTTASPRATAPSATDASTTSTVRLAASTIAARSTPC